MSTQPNSYTRASHSQALDLLRFPLAVIVVLVHTFPMQTGFNIMGKPFDFENFPIFYELLCFISSFLRGQSVPIYYFISGYVFFLGVDNFNKDRYIQKLKNRTKTLLIPYLIWNVIALGIRLTSYIPMFRAYAAHPDQTFNPTVWTILSSFWSTKGLFPDSPLAVPVNTPLWFVRNLMIVVLCTPIIYNVIKRFRAWPILFLCMLWFVKLFFPEVSDGGFIGSFLFFSFGAYMSINKKDMVAEFGRYFKISIILYPCLGVIGMLSIHFFPSVTEVIKQINIIVGLLFAYNIAVWLLQKNYCKVNEFLAASSFFIYVSHAIICGKIRAFLMLIIKPINEFSFIIVYILTLVLTIVSLLTAYWVLKRYFPSVLKLVTGRK